MVIVGGCLWLVELAWHEVVAGYVVVDVCDLLCWMAVVLAAIALGHHALPHVGQRLLRSSYLASAFALRFAMASGE